MTTLFRDQVREHVGYWIMLYGTGSQRKGLHLPAPVSSRDEPVTRCGYEDDVDATPTAKDVDVFPRGYDPDRICTPCARDLAAELGCTLRGDQRAD